MVRSRAGGRTVGRQARCKQGDSAGVTPIDCFIGAIKVYQDAQGGASDQPRGSTAGHFTSSQAREKVEKECDASRCYAGNGFRHHRTMPLS
jgi:hypothetical protein